MTKQPRQSTSSTYDFPLRLCEVLEKEFVAVHGTSPGSIGPQPAPRSDWLLTPDDVDCVRLVELLRSPAHADYSDAVAVVAAKLALDLPPQVCSAPGFKQRLVDRLNALLSDTELLFDQRLIDRRLDAAKLADAIADLKSPHRPDPAADVANRRIHQLLNRLLLEAAFPESVIARADTVRLRRLYATIHALRGPESIHSALCLSGGGIRSASFALGVLQELARRGILGKFEYLSTVSGGGYIGSWLSTWIHRQRDGIDGVIAELSRTARPEGAGAERGRVLRPESGPIRFLRSYSHFLNPKAGLFSVDTWAWIGIYLRNLLLNWLAVIPLMLIVIAVPRLYASHLRAAQFDGHNVTLVAVIAGLAALLSILCATVNRPSIRDPVHPEQRYEAGERVSLVQRVLVRCQRQIWVLALGVAPLLLFALLTTLVVWEFSGGYRPGWLRAPLPVVFLVTGEAVTFLGWLISSLLVPVRDWKKRRRELVAMLAAGAITWLMVGGLADAAVRMSTDHEATLTLDTIRIFPAHLFTVFAIPVLLLAVMTGMTLFVGGISKLRWIEDEDREWWARFGAWLLIAISAWIALGVITIFGPPLLLEFPKLVSGIGGVSGLLALILGKSSFTSATGTKSAGKLGGRFDLSMLGVNTLATAAVIFFAAFLAFLSLLTSLILAAVDPSIGVCACDVFSDPQRHLYIAAKTPFQTIALFVLALLALLSAAALTINLNKFSLHAAYRIRIVRTFLGASRREDRRPNPFTGFDPLDNVQMHELQPGLLRETDFLDLARLVEALHQAANGKVAEPAATLVRWMDDERRDPDHVLRSRLKQATPGKPVLKTLQRDLLVALNRVLETEQLDQAAGFAAALQKARNEHPGLERFIADGNLIFANRIVLEAAYPDAISKYRLLPPPHKFIHVLNLTLNLVHGRSLAWQERKAAPFLVTPMYAGSYYLGYRAARDYGGFNGISIGTAAAVSGAAVSPNMGYSSSSVTALLLTLFNVRLGWWLGNPGLAGNTTYRRSEPRFSLRPLIAEALGMTDDRSPYIYLSDGGHFENLGLFEMVMRRCRLIVVTDAGADPNYQFQDLGNAVRKIRIDLGVPIDFAPMPIRKRVGTLDTDGRYCALGRIGYSTIDGDGAVDGVLVIIKPTCYGIEPQDVLNYAAQNEDFPQEPTLDQFFGESQFESYRRLGQFETETIYGPEGVTQNPEWAVTFVKAVCKHLNRDLTKEPWLQRWVASCGGAS